MPSLFWDLLNINFQSSQSSMSKTHSRQKSFVPMIDEEITSCDVAVVGQPHKYTNDHAFVTVESSPSEKTPSTVMSPQTTSLHSSNNNLIKTKRSKKGGPTCCRVFSALISLILLVILIAAGIYYWQVHSSRESGNSEPKFVSRKEDKPRTLPQGRENTTTTRTSSSTPPTVLTSRVFSTGHTFAKKSSKIFKSVSGKMDKGRNYVISPLGFDYSMSVFENISMSPLVISRHYFDDSKFYKSI